MIYSANPFVVFSIDESSYAIPLGVVERVVRMVEITSLPGSPEVVAGVIEVHGRVIPVLDLRRRFALPSREFEPDDYLIIACTSRRTVSLPVDSVTGVIFRSQDQINGVERFAPGTRYISGAMQVEDNLVLIQDLDRFFSTEEESQLSDSLELE